MIFDPILKHQRTHPRDCAIILTSFAALGMTANSGTRQGDLYFILIMQLQK